MAYINLDVLMICNVLCVCVVVGLMCIYKLFNGKMLNNVWMVQ